MKKNRLKSSNIIKKIALALAALFGFILLIFAIFGRPNHGLEFVFLDVGQGDSTLIKTPDGQVILIDGGPDNKVLRGLGKNLPFYRRRIDSVILSHYHDDHAVGLIEIIKRYRVKTLIYPPENSDSLLMEELIKTASQHEVELKTLSVQAELSFGADCELNLLNPNSLKIKKDPNNSLVSRLDCGGQKFLLAGDNPATAEKALLASGWPLSADVLKASHHGSNTSNGAEFLEKVAPRLIVISVGADNRFGHPGGFFLERVSALNIPIKRTDNEGDVKIFAK